MNVLQLIGMALGLILLTAFSMVYGYALAIRHMRKDRELLRQRRYNYQQSDTPIYDQLSDEFYDVI
jgi:hypothetical protein